MKQAEYMQAWHNPEPGFREDVPMRACDLAGCTVERQQDEMINFILVVGSPGHFLLRPLGCAESEHWACSIEHWEKIAHQCITEHGKEHLKIAHQELANNGIESAHQ